MDGQYPSRLRHPSSTRAKAREGGAKAARRRREGGAKAARRQREGA
jgi:hypothetical protein